MTNPYPFTKTVRRSQFASECVSSMGSAIVTVRLRGGSGPLDAAEGEIVHDGTMTDAQIQAIIDAHVPLETNDEKMAKPGISAMIAKLEAGLATPLEVQSVLAKVLRYLRRESI